MNTRHVQNKSAPEYLNLAAGKAVTVRVSRGTVVRSLQGRVWVTQDGDERDHIVPPGACYCAGNRGRIVVSAVDGHSRIAVYRDCSQLAGIRSNNEVRDDAVFTDTLENAARQAMAETTAALARSAWHYVQCVWRRLVRSLSSGVMLPVYSRNRSSRARQPFQPC